MGNIVQPVYRNETLIVSDVEVGGRRSSTPAASSACSPDTSMGPLLLPSAGPETLRRDICLGTIFTCIAWNSTSHRVPIDAHHLHHRNNIASNGRPSKKPTKPPLNLLTTPQSRPINLHLDNLLQHNDRPRHPHRPRNLLHRPRRPQRSRRLRPLRKRQGLALQKLPHNPLPEKRDRPPRPRGRQRKHHREKRAVSPVHDAAVRGV